ncbi:HAD-IA family hydrolase [Pseudomonas aeruginosa]
MIKVALFDLDNTLAHTESLEEIRNLGQYEKLTPERLNKIRPYPKTINLIKKLHEKGVKIGVVTNAGRNYAIPVLKHLDIPHIDVTVTYSDVGAAGMKPSPNGILLALEKLGIEPSQDVIYIGDDYVDIVAAYRAGVKPVIPSWGPRKPVSQMPAVVLSTEYLLDEIDDTEQLQFVADRSAENQSFNFPRKRLYFAPLDLATNVVTLREDLKIICLGRYYSQKSPITARLHDQHQLSKDIFEKELDQNFKAPEYWVDLLAHCIENIPSHILQNGNTFDIFTIIPSKKEKNKRLENLLQRTRKKSQSPSLFLEDVFEFSAGAPSLKTLSRDGRLAAVTQSLHLTHNYDLRGKTVLLFDDVMTTGSTFTRAFELLNEAGAKLIVGLILAKNVSIAEEDKDCPNCGRAMRIQKNKTTNERFWGCTGYHDKQSKCTYAEPLEIKKCPKCGRSMHMKTNRYNQQKFIACSGYNQSPKCNYSENV